MKILITGGTGLVGSALKSISGDYDNYTFFFLVNEIINHLKITFLVQNVYEKM